MWGGREERTRERGKETMSKGKKSKRSEKASEVAQWVKKLLPSLANRVQALESTEEKRKPTPKNYLLPSTCGSPLMRIKIHTQINVIKA